MIGEIIFSWFLGVGLVALQASAQYEHHHQQFFRVPENNILKPKTFNTKALTAFKPRATSKYRYAFASTFSYNGSGVSDSVLLVKIKENMPLDSPFKFVWGKVYTEKKGLSINVEDVHYIDKTSGGFIICGDVSTGAFETEGFLLMTKNNGNVAKAKRYKGVVSFKSVVPWHNNKGFIAVGQTPQPENGSKGRGAVYVSVKRKRLKTSCAVEVNGNFEIPGSSSPSDGPSMAPSFSPTETLFQSNLPSSSPTETITAAVTSSNPSFSPTSSENPSSSNPSFSPTSSENPSMAPTASSAPTGFRKIESGFNKVIQYKVGEDEYYAAVGETTLYYDGTLPLSADVQKNTDVLVAVVDKDCDVDWKGRYGSEGEDGKQLNERGMSIAQYSAQGGLVVTGNTKKESVLGGLLGLTFSDTLVFKIKASGFVDWMGHYHSNELFGGEVGTAVQMSTLQGQEQTILVAGQTMTRELWLVAQSLMDPLEDAFLMELDKDDGTVKKFEVFGAQFDTANGVLEGNVDLHLSDDHHAVIMGNTKVHRDDPNIYPYLIERYNNIASECVHKALTVSKQTYKFPDALADDEEVTVENKLLNIEASDQKLDQNITCPKKNPVVLPDP